MEGNIVFKGKTVFNCKMKFQINADSHCGTRIHIRDGLDRYDGCGFQGVKTDPHET